jgi:negative regulator of flagellin synthesis FlgM
MADINKIKPNLQPDTYPTGNADTRGNRVTQSPTSPTAEQADKVSLSETLAKLENTLTEVPDVNIVKVDAIKRSIEDGSYQIDSQELARKMIDFEGDL